MSVENDFKWNTDSVIKFLNILKLDCLWNTSHENYLKRDARDAALNEVIDQLETEGFGILSKEQLKCKIKSLKDAYRIELNKIKKSVKSGTSLDDVYKPKLCSCSQLWIVFERL